LRIYDEFNASSLRFSNANASPSTFISVRDRQVNLSRENAALKLLENPAIVFTVQLNPILGRLRRKVAALVRAEPGYAQRHQQELLGFTAPAKVNELPAIAHYWFNKHLVPMMQCVGFTNAHECIRAYLEKLCRTSGTCVFLSIGSGKGEAEIQMAMWLREHGLHNFAFECLDINESLLAQGRELAASRTMSHHFTFETFDVNTWAPSRTYHAILALQSLHHVVELEKLLDAVHTALKDQGYFLTDDMIGRNGHQRWPEALTIVHELWEDLPESYRFNQQLRRFEKLYQNWDCSTEGFEGIRSQDILPLLIQRFNFELFFAFGNVIDVFIDRGFGHNFNPEGEWDRSFIDRVHAVDMRNLEHGTIKPTHLLAAMRKIPVQQPLIYKHFTPDYCVRRVRPSVLERMRIWRGGQY